ncbi:MAG: CDP-diacylglycerol--glycerol-3-phosphate 3-phosphatidyltransferase [Mycoplasma sp.]
MEISNFKKQIPNILTVFRIVLIIPIIVLAAINSLGLAYSINFSNFKIDVSWNYVSILILFIVASITDWLDGFLSRRNNWVSDFGKILDPIADKVLINTIFVILAINSNIHWIFIIVFILRDTVVDGIRMFASSTGVIIPANFFGKLKTVTQMLTIIFLLIIPGVSNLSPDWWYWGVQNIFVYCSVLTSLLSGIIYIISFIKIKK